VAGLEPHANFQTNHREIAADPALKKTLVAASTGGKTSYRLGTSPATTASLKILEYEESVLKQLQSEYVGSEKPKGSNPVTRHHCKR